MDAERLAEIRRRAEAATPGPWQTYGEERDRPGIETNEGSLIVWGDVEDKDDEAGIGADTFGNRWPDATFIAASREDIPDLLAEVASLTAERDRAREVAMALSCHGGDRCPHDPPCGPNEEFERLMLAFDDVTRLMGERNKAEAERDAERSLREEYQIKLAFKSGDLSRLRADVEEVRAAIERNHDAKPRGGRNHRGRCYRCDVLAILDRGLKGAGDE